MGDQPIKVGARHREGRQGDLGWAAVLVQGHPSQAARLHTAARLYGCTAARLRRLSTVGTLWVAAAARENLVPLLHARSGHGHVDTAITCCEVALADHSTNASGSPDG